jgi:hypothetical protein
MRPSADLGDAPADGRATTARSLAGPAKPSQPAGSSDWDWWASVSGRAEAPRRCRGASFLPDLVIPSRVLYGVSRRPLAERRRRRAAGRRIDRCGARGTSFDGRTSNADREVIGCAGSGTPRTCPPAGPLTPRRPRRPRPGGSRRARAPDRRGKRCSTRSWSPASRPWLCWWPRAGSPGELSDGRARIADAIRARSFVRPPERPGCLTGPWAASIHPGPMARTKDLSGHGDQLRRKHVRRPMRRHPPSPDAWLART